MVLTHLIDKGDISLDELKEILVRRPKEPSSSMRHLKMLFNNHFVNKGDSEVSLDKVASLLRSMGLVDITPDEYPILLEVLDKNKDGKIDFSDFVSQIPTFDCEKVFGEEANPPVVKEEVQPKPKGKKKLHLSAHVDAEPKKDNRFKYDKQTSSQHSVVILSDEDYQKIIEDYKEKMSM